MQTAYACLLDQRNNTPIEANNAMGNVGSSFKSLLDLPESGKSNFMSTLFDIVMNQGSIMSPETMDQLETLMETDSSGKKISLENFLEYFEGNFSFLSENEQPGEVLAGNSLTRENLESLIAGEEAELKFDPGLLTNAKFNQEKKVTTNLEINKKLILDNSEVNPRSEVTSIQGGNAKLGAENPHFISQEFSSPEKNLQMGSEQVADNIGKVSAKSESAMLSSLTQEISIKEKVIQVDPVLEKEGAFLSPDQAGKNNGTGSLKSEAVTIRSPSQDASILEKDIQINTELKKEESDDNSTMRFRHEPKHNVINNSEIESILKGDNGNVTETVKMNSASVAKDILLPSESVLEESEKGSGKSGDQQQLPPVMTDSELSSQNSEDSESKYSTNIHKNPVQIKGNKTDSDINSQSRIAELMNKNNSAAQEEMDTEQGDKSRFPEGDETSRFVNTYTRDFLTQAVNPDSLPGDLNLKSSPQRPVTSENDILINKVAKFEAESGNETDTSSSSNHSFEKNSDSVSQTKEPQPFQKMIQTSVMKQVVEKALLNLKNSHSSISISLKPEVLGRLKMQISTENNQVMIRILTEVPMVKEIIESNVGQLKADFQNQGMEIKAFEVSVDHDSAQNQKDAARFSFANKSAGQGANFGEDTQEESVVTLAHKENSDGSGIIDFFA